MSKPKIEKNTTHFFIAYTTNYTTESMMNLAMAEISKNIYWPQVKAILPEFQAKGLWFTVVWEVVIAE